MFSKTPGRLVEIISWSFYDFANTIFSMNVITFYFALWVIDDCGAPDIVYSLINSTSMLFVVFFSPVFGVIADRSKKVTFYLALFTIISCIFTYLIGFFNSLIFGLIFFLIANFAYQSALVFYNFLLTSISDEKNRGRISGIGVGFGYIGTITGLFLVASFVIREKFDAMPNMLKPIIELLQVSPLTGENSMRINAFIPTAILFLIFSIPCFLFVKSREPSINYDLKKVKSGIFKEILTTFKSIKKYKNIFYFLLSNFLFMDAIHTVILFMSVFSSKAKGFTDSEIVNLFLLSTTAAIFGSFFWGIITDIIGHKKTLIIILYCWLIVLFSAAFVESKSIYWGIGALCGISMGGVWITARPLLISISPPEKIGEFFGIYGLTGKCASIIGPMIWGLITLTFQSYGNLKYRLAILAQGLLIIAGIFILKKVKAD